jgi:hypothetical protein
MCRHLLFCAGLFPILKYSDTIFLEGARRNRNAGNCKRKNKADHPLFG